MQLKNIPEDERPRERLAQLGIESLTTAELLAILLGSGTRGKSVLSLALELLSYFGTLKALSEATVQELCVIKGIGKARAIQLKAALGLATRLQVDKPDHLITVMTPAHAYQLVKGSLQHEKKEHLLAILLDARGKVIQKEKISVGTLTQTLVHPREIFYPAIRHQAASLILVHNHPSGELEPSLEDLKATESLIKAGKLMNLPIHDHLIVSFKGFWSIRESHPQMFR